MGSRGTTLLDRHLKGGRLTRGEALLAKCADCMNRYVDGRDDCAVATCPLYPFAPYRGCRERAPEANVQGVP